ncbi:pyruvate kinase [Coxiella burnetii]|uniref:Pyruvate kinase n=2 Tax=Coxiella burnetii TaxID=777 RepID=Q83AU7_COXBU|nr:pyruvate kinase [Coxiella burnetii]NP_820761.2 pyruvate kinase [Coxiella burnetii RSA 493]AAO91275.2 pyruvate kinase [Coxiella burnetii RSA 493]ARI66536.1 pyruvate kinase [Coxiella burnetii]ARK27978.1 pyruvate kinase [Coxiella burnetii]MCF2096385.1 pyruvate kinase [Coxiella burnetii]MCF2098523.1 pyruvate kinase [Coxiella burnetii]
MSKNNNHMLRSTKIIATLGPATDDLSILEEIIHEGVDIIRLNFSHGTHEKHKQRIEMVRKAAKKQERVIGILADLQGPKIRISSFKTGKINLKKGELFILDAGLPPEEGTEKSVGIDYKNLPKDVKAEDILLLDDGRLTLKVQNVKGEQIICRVVEGGALSDHKGINRLGGGLSAEAMTEKDINDLKFAVDFDVDYVAISFPRDAQDILKAKHLVQGYKGKAGIIAKIERTEAVKNIDAIIEASDGVMVARGDLAVEIGDAQVPLVQKDIIHRARSMDKPVIIATQMMESMIHATVPTRAEVSDVANAVLDNTDAVMLSAETAVGDYPVLAVAAMARTCVVSESQPRSHISRHRVECRFKRIDEAIAMATMYAANHLDIKAIITLTESGITPLWMSRIRTAIPIYGLSRFDKSLGRMTLYRGVYPIKFDPTQYTRDEINVKAVETLQSQDLLKNGDLVVLTKGDYMGVGGGSNAMKIMVVGKVV